MGLDVDVYLVKKFDYKDEEEILDKINEGKFIDTIYMRKPSLIWDKYITITNYKREGVLSNDEIEKLKKELLPIIKNFRQIYEECYGVEIENDVDCAIWNLKKYVDFYDILTYKNEENLIFVNSSW